MVHISINIRALNQILKLHFGIVSLERKLIVWDKNRQELMPVGSEKFVLGNLNFIFSRAFLSLS